MFKIGVIGGKKGKILKVARIPEIRNKAQHIVRHKNNRFLCYWRIQLQAKQVNQLLVSDCIS